MGRARLRWTRRSRSREPSGRRAARPLCPATRQSGMRFRPAGEHFYFYPAVSAVCPLLCSRFLLFPEASAAKKAGDACIPMLSWTGARTRVPAPSPAPLARCLQLSTRLPECWYGGYQVAPAILRTFLRGNEESLFSSRFDFTTGISIPYRTRLPTVYICTPPHRIPRSDASARFSANNSFFRFCRSALNGYYCFILLTRNVPPFFAFPGSTTPRSVRKYSERHGVYRIYRGVRARGCSPGGGNARRGEGRGQLSGQRAAISRGQS